MNHGRFPCLMMSHSFDPSPLCWEWLTVASETGAVTIPEDAVGTGTGQGGEFVGRVLANEIGSVLPGRIAVQGNRTTIMAADGTHERRVRLDCRMPRRVQVLVNPGRRADLAWVPWRGGSALPAGAVLGGWQQSRGPALYVAKPYANARHCKAGWVSVESQGVYFGLDGCRHDAQCSILCVLDTGQ